LDYVALAVAWQQSKLPVLPPILTWRNNPPIPDDPHTALHDAGARLRERGLIDSRGELHDDLYGVLSLFAHAPYEVSLRYALKPDVEIRAAVTAQHHKGVIGVVAGDRVIFERLRPDAVIGALVDELTWPAHPTPGEAVSVPNDALQTAMAEAADWGDEGDAFLLSALRRHGVSSENARQFAALLGQKRRIGQFEVAVRDDRGRREPSERIVRCIDTPSGRAAMYQRRDYLVTAPADHALFVRVLTELLDFELRQISDDRRYP
jgi:hypothetical protein